MLFSASFPSAYYESGDPAYYLKRQAFFAALGLAAMFVVSKINYQRWRGASKILLGFAIFLLILVIIPHNPLAQTRNNATRWLGTQTISFQPSEIAKLAVVVFFADSISKKRDKMQTLRFGVIPYTAVLGVISSSSRAASYNTAPRVSRCGTTRGSTPPTRAIRCARA